MRLLPNPAKSGLRQGLTTDAAKQVAKYGFEELGFRRVEILVVQENIPARKQQRNWERFEKGYSVIDSNKMELPMRHTYIPSYLAILELITLPDSTHIPFVLHM